MQHCVDEKGQKTLVSTSLVGENNETHIFDIGFHELYMQTLHNGKVNMLWCWKGDRIKKWILNYFWEGYELYFKVLMMPRPEVHKKLIENIHDELGHFGKNYILEEITKRFYMNNMIKVVKKVVQD